jgi:hypothetical protein
MTWKKWGFKSGEACDLSEVIGACDARIREGGVICSESKNETVRRMEQYAPATIVWSPLTERGWGASVRSTRIAGARSRENPSSPLTQAKRERRSGTSRYHVKKRVSSQHDP